MKSLTTTILLATALLFTGLAAHAFTVDLVGTNATGISDLNIGGTAYDVAFQFAQADTAPVACGSAVPCDVFFGDETAAQAAITAINAALNPTIAITVGSTEKANYFVPYSQGGGSVEAVQGTFTADSMWLSIGASLDNTDIIEFARFSPAVIPIPPAAWLFGSALAILGWIRRRTNDASLT